MLNPRDFDRYFTSEGRDLLRELLGEGKWVVEDAATAPGRAGGTQKTTP
jgi:hypothetical protein